LSTIIYDLGRRGNLCGRGGIMKIGIFLTCQQPPGSDMIAALEGQYAMARLARDRGWDAVATGQHYLSEGVRQVQLVPFLARLAAEAGEMTGIAGVLLTTLHNPVEVAEAIASLDAIWRGNFVFGVGLGYRDVEFDAFGVPRGRRVRRFEQCLKVVKRLWTEDNVSFENEVCKLSNVTMTCRPVQQPHPPIWFAANNDRAVQRAARLGDSWFINPHATIPEIQRQLGLYRAELARLGKPFPGVLPYIREIYCAKDRATALQMAGPYLSEKYRRNTGPMPNGDRTRYCLERTRSASLSRTCCATASCSAAPRNATSSCVRAGSKPGRIISCSARTGSGMPVGHALASMRLISDELLPALHRITAANR
jgi:alkanesulfonate monooxygenase SsuD/methylene tetrahydromethanopterin reductase-like flavin-dependent oxidoreductase (luciferase family)